MRKGIYILRDHRDDRMTKPLSALVHATITPNAVAVLGNIGWDYGLEVDFDPDDPVFSDDGDRAVLPVEGNGSVELLWITEERYQDLEHMLHVGPEFKWPPLKTGEEIQNFLYTHFFWD